MRGFLAVLERELIERRLLFLAALLIGLFALAAPWLPGPSGVDPAELRGGMALGLAVAVSSLLAVTLGASVVARDLGERRLGFYFARPLSGAALWAGKMLAAFFIPLAAGAIVLLPALLAGGRIDLFGEWFLSGIPNGAMPRLLALLLGLLLLVLLSHVVSIVIHARSAWLLLDVGALCLIADGLLHFHRMLLSQGAEVASGWLLTGFSVAILLAAALAGFVQVVRGRTDLRAGHRLLSLTLWGALGATLLASGLFTRWVLGATPEDLVGFYDIVPAPAGNWVVLQGEAASRGGYSPAFLVDLASSRFIRIPGTVGFGRGPWWRRPVFSEDGRQAVWIDSPTLEQGDLVRIDLDQLGARPVRTAVTGIPWFPDIVLSPDGSRVAVLVDKKLSVDDLGTGRLLASAVLPDEGSSWSILRFPERGRIRIFQASRDGDWRDVRKVRIRISDLDIARRRLVPVSRVEIPGNLRLGQISPGGDLALLRWMKTGEIVTADLRSGRVLATLPATGEWTQSLFLPDDSVALLGRVGEGVARGTVLRVLTPDGAERLRIPLPGVRYRFGARPEPDLLVVGTSAVRSPRSAAEWTSWLVDLRTGASRQLGRRMAPAVQGGQVAGELPSRLFSRGHGELVLLDLDSGQLRTVLRGEPVQAAAH